MKPVFISLKMMETMPFWHLFFVETETKINSFCVPKLWQSIFFNHHYIIILFKEVHNAVFVVFSGKFTSFFVVQAADLTFAAI